MIVVVAGVAGSGKTTVGRGLADALGLPFLDADDFHPPGNIAKMRRGQPLTEADRDPWLHALNAELRRRAAAGAVLACSALTRTARGKLSAGLRSDDLAFVFLHVDVGELRRRLAQRTGHFAGPDLLASQLAALEEPVGGVVVDGGRPTGAVVAEILTALGPGSSRGRGDTADRG